MIMFPCMLLHNETEHEICLFFSHVIIFCNSLLYREYMLKKLSTVENVTITKPIKLKTHDIVIRSSITSVSLFDMNYQEILPPEEK